MKDVKRRLDPQWLLNRGNYLQRRSNRLWLQHQCALPAAPL